MDLTECLALIIFILTYLVIAVHKTKWFEIKRSYAAVIGAVLMLIAGALTFNDAFDSINFSVIFLLIGMMSVVAGLEYTGFFSVVSNYLLKHSTSGTKLLIMIMIASAVLSAIALNDAVVLMFTPIVIRCCIKIDVNPIPYLVGLMMSANIGSIATAVGNPQNAYIISKTGIDFVTYAKYSVPIAIACLIACILIIWLYYRKKLNERYAFDKDIAESDRDIDRTRLSLMVVLLIGTFVGFVLSGTFHYELYQVALIAGALSLIIVASCRPKDVVWVAKKIDWNILLFFIGLFVLIGGAVKSGLVNDIASLFPGFRAGETPDVAGLTVFSVILSNLVSNVPAVMLIAEMMPSADLALWIVLAASSTLAGNTTLIGSAANIIVAEGSEKSGVRINFFRFMIIGVIVTMVTCAIMIGIVSLIFN